MKLFLILGLVLFLLSCESRRNESFVQKDIPEDVLRVVTRMSGTTYYQDRDGLESGYEYEIIKKFAADHEFKLDLIVVDSIDEVFDALELKKADLYAAGITKTSDREKKFNFSTEYFEVQQQVVCRNRRRVKKLEDLADLKIKIPAETSYEETLERTKKEVSNLNWESVQGESSETLIEALWESKEGCTLADSNVVKVHRRYFPELKVVYTFPSKEKLAWIVDSKKKNLIQKVNSWLKKKESISFMEKIESRYYGHLVDFDVYDTQVFIKRIESRLPKYRKWLKQAAKEWGFNWRFLAAVAYQESRWNPKAKSPTGVRGFMMLTKNTAKSVGVKNRLDAKESIFGGAKYLRRMTRRIPSYVKGKDRKWFALASYNVGYYHLRDARALALLKEYNPNNWSGVRRALPLLSDKRYFKKTWYGYARGKEPVIYVDRIRNYFDILSNYSRRVRQPAGAN